MRKYLLPLFIANLVAFAAVGVSYLVYSRILSPQQFGAYAAALAIGNLAVLILDGGIKTSIIKHAENVTQDDEAILLVMMLGFSALLLMVLYLCQSVLTQLYPASRDQAVFIATFVAVYLVTYPWIGLSTAHLERKLFYSQLAWIESVGIVLERGAPAILLMSVHLGLGAFVAGLALGRVARIVLLGRSHPIAFRWKRNVRSGSIRSLLQEGVMFQLGGAASAIRDNLHVIVVGPIYGSVWVGYYAWGFQLCTIASQAFVQISARVSLSVTAKAPDFPNRWATITQQIAMLTTATAPILLAVIVVAPILNRLLFEDKWRVAITLLPLLCARMLPGIACTPIGALVLVEKGASAYAGALWMWTGVEVAAAYLAVKAFGPYGLALSYSVTAWIGIYLLLKPLIHAENRLFRQVCHTIFARRGLWVSIGTAVGCVAWIFFTGQPVSITLAGGAMLCVAGAYLIDPDLRFLLLHKRAI